jgi:hypothetical protein
MRRMYEAMTGIPDPSKAAGSGANPIAGKGAAGKGPPKGSEETKEQDDKR